MSVYQRDLRRLLLSLQLWAASGGSCRQRPSPINYKKTCLKEKTTADGGVVSVVAPNTPTKTKHKLTAQNSLLGAIVEDSRSTDEFEVVKTKKRARRLVIHDEDSTDMQVLQSPIKCFPSGIFHDESSSQGDTFGAFTQDNRDVDEQMAVSHNPNAPAFNDLAFYSITGGIAWLSAATSDTTGLQVTISLIISLMLQWSLPFSPPRSRGHLCFL